MKNAILRMGAFAALIMLSLAAVSTAAASASFTVTRADDSSKWGAYSSGQTLCSLGIFVAKNDGDAPGTIQSIGVGGPFNVSDYVVCIDSQPYPTAQVSAEQAGGITLGYQSLASVAPNLVVPVGASVRITIRGTVWNTGRSAWANIAYLMSDAKSQKLAFDPNDKVYSYVADTIIKEGTANCSLRAMVGPGMIATMGVVVRGDPGLKYPYLVRAVGPGITALGVDDALPDPMILVYKGNTVIDQNDDWSGLEPAFTQTGAFSLTKGSKDAALIVWLSPGNYTFQVKTKDNSVGEVLIEQYILPSDPHLNG